MIPTLSLGKSGPPVMGVLQRDLSHLTRRLFGSMVRRIASLPVPAG
ncbi:MAG: hypothetical protein ABSF45_11980 [Terriglobia bacterium]|jgi:hypothetical protein